MAAAKKAIQTATPSALSHVLPGAVDPFFALKLGSFACFCSCGNAVETDAHEVAYTEDGQVEARSPEGERPPRDGSAGSAGAGSAGAHATNGHLPAAPAPRPKEREPVANSTSAAVPNESHSAAQEAHPKPEAAIEKRKPDFSGTWLMTKIEGDMDSFLAEMGQGYLKRSLIKSMGYGVNRLTETITQHQDNDGFRMTVTVVNPITTVENKFIVNGKEQPGLSFENEAVIIAPRWESDELVTEVWQPGSHVKTATQRRSIVNGSYRMEIESPKGLVVKRCYVRQ